MASRFTAAKEWGKWIGAGLVLLFWTRSLLTTSAQGLQVRICDLQGGSDVSPYIGQQVETVGVVQLDLDSTSRRGFFLQHENCDSDPLSSDGIFVYLGEPGDWVNAGDHARVSGQVQEYYGLTELVTAPDQVEILSSGNSLPEPVLFDPPVDRSAGEQYFESIEGMRLGLAGARVVGPTDADDRTWVVGDGAAIERLFLDDSTGLGLCVDDGGIAEIKPEARVWDMLQGLTGVLDFRFGLFCLQLDSEPLLTPVALEPAGAPQGGLRIATFNLKNLFDTLDDLETEDSVLLDEEYQRRLRKRALAIQEMLAGPDLIALQEVENDRVLSDLIARPELTTSYAALWLDGPDLRGIDNALLYRPERVSLVRYESRQGCTGLVDGLGPDGNGDLVHPANELTCDRDGDGTLDGNRLFSRPPLVAHFQLLGNAQPGEIWLIANHWKSKSEDTLAVAYTLPRRVAQAGYVAEIVADIQADDPQVNIILLGDLNDTLASEPLAELAAAGLVNTWDKLPPAQRYTYIYQGYSQPLDHILVLGPWLTRPLDGVLWAARINADYPARYANLINTPSGSSDHDLLLVRYNFYSHLNYLPLVAAPSPGPNQAGLP